MQSMDNRASQPIALTDLTDSSQQATHRQEAVQSLHHLRQQADELIRQRTALSPHDLNEMPPDKIQQLFNEMHVYQVVYEMQIEELRHNQEVLDATRARYFDLYDTAPVGYCTLRESGLIEEVNCMATTLLGKTRDELINQSLTKFIISEDQHVYSLHRQLLLETGTPQVCDVRLIKKDAPLFWVQLNIATTHSEKGATIIRIVLTDITAQKLATMVLEASEDRFRTLFQDVPAVAVQGYMPDGTVHYWNRASESLYGYSTQEAVGRHLIDLIIPPEMRQEVELAIRQMAETGQPISPSELSLMRKDGSRVSVFSSHTVVQVSGRVQEMFCIDIDLTQLKQAEDSLRRSETRLQAANRKLEEQNEELTARWEKSRLLRNELEAAYKKLNDEKCLLQSVMEAMPVGLAITDANGGTIQSNSLFERIWGELRLETRSIEDYKGIAWWADTGDKVTPEEWASAKAIQKGETTIGQVIRIQRLDGSEAFVINSASPVYQKDDGIIGSVVVVQDISELKRVELALYESEQRLRLFIEHAPAALAMFDRDMRYLYVSMRWLSDYGLEGRDLCGMSHYELFPEISAQWKDFHRRGLAGEILQQEADRFERADGSVQWVKWEIRPWYRVSGDVGGIVIFTEDITKRKHAEDMLLVLNEELERKVEQRTLELQKTQKEYMHSEKLSVIGKLSASIAHEFNNPLQGIMSVLIGLKNRAVMDEEDNVLLDEAIEECSRIRDLIRSLQEFNRPSSGIKTLLNVHNSLDSLILLHKSDFKKKRISVVLDYDERLPLIEVVPDQIKQVFLNLLTNAADACRQSGGKITISTWQEDEEHIAVSIKDTGIGIQPSDKESIFRPFYTTKHEVKGTGLGLSISHGIIENHQGQLRVESQPGEGATFTVLLPIKAVDDPALNMCQ